MEDHPSTIRVYPGELRPVYYTSVLASRTTTTLEVGREGGREGRTEGGREGGRERGRARERESGGREGGRGKE